MKPFPDFLIIGVQRGGTTSLYDYLTRHPRIAKAKRKEVSYFDFNYDKGRAWYRAHFPWWIRLRSNVLTGEATPNYLFHPIAPTRVHAMHPGTKLIVLLRDPVHRAFSQYQLARRRGWEPLSFDEAIRCEEDRLKGEATRLADPSYPGLSYRRYSYVTRGFYADQIHTWTTHFSFDQFLFLKSEDLYADPRTVLGTALTFLELAPIGLPTYEHRNRGGYEVRMSNETHAYLTELYRPHNMRLYQLIGRDLGWNN